MKTLDEVIKAYEVCHASVLSCEGCPYDNGERYRDSDCYITDALHYMKEYREKHDDILRMEEALGYCEIMDNPPLTWDELKEMEGKPVWVETQCGCELDFEWMIINYLLNFEDGTEALLTSSGLLEQRRQNNTWQAYRKERINNVSRNND